eukprot:7456663-Prorocentrum_lima.AAC.1
MSAGAKVGFQVFFHKQAPPFMSSMCVEMRLVNCGWNPPWEPVTGFALVSNFHQIFLSVTPCW